MKTKAMTGTMKESMTVTMKRVRALAASALAACTLVSCGHRELYYPSSPTAEVVVRFDWSAAPGAEAEGMCAWFFPEDGGKAVRCDFTDPSGGTARIPWGSYRVAYMNNDTETVQVRGEDSYGTLELYTRQGSLLEAVNAHGSPPGANPGGEPVVAAPEAVWGGSLEDVLLERGEDEKAPRSVVLPVRPQTCGLSLEVAEVENLKYVLGVGASLSGLSGSLLLGSGATSAVRSTVPFAAESDGVSKVTAGMRFFGLSSGADTGRTLTLYFILADGSRHYYRFDVADRVNNAPDKRHIRIVIDRLSLPKPIVNGGGFHPQVDGWEEEEHTLGF
ncbi:DUF5119 domain-containing protein [Bacteroides heparinolyticus]|uniref:DUF5119 domain-containing protein n=1 Tax=Prevotella heparinolytica TaxID=28113 RepID=A0A3P2ADW3_9BACE|nr:DUF5119 domain-containing protein [Bacteroides heparinolyticus]RRD92886.1 DUF5119 domain-containing protein [Bacteroides heparinolyticus]